MACGCIPFSALTLTKNKTGACCKRLPTIGGLTGGVVVCVGLLRLALVWRLLSVSMLRTSPILSVKKPGYFLEIPGK